MRQNLIETALASATVAGAVARVFYCLLIAGGLLLFFSSYNKPMIWLVSQLTR